MVVADSDALLEDITQAQDALFEALMNLRFKPDKAILKQLVEKASNIDTASYTPESAETFATAKTAAEAVLADETATQEQVNVAVSALEQAMAGLGSRIALTGDSSTDIFGHSQDGGHYAHRLGCGTARPVRRSCIEKAQILDCPM